MTISRNILFLEPKTLSMQLFPEPLLLKNSEWNEGTCSKFIERVVLSVFLSGFYHLWVNPFP